MANTISSTSTMCEQWSPLLSKAILVYGKPRQMNYQIMEGKYNVTWKVERIRGKQNRGTSPYVWSLENPAQRKLLLKHKPAGKLRTYPGEKAFTGKEWRGTKVCKDIPVSEGEYGRPKELRDGQPGYYMQNVHGRWN